MTIDRTQTSGTGKQVRTQQPVVQPTKVWSALGTQSSRRTTQSGYGPAYGDLNIDPDLYSTQQDDEGYKPKSFYSESGKTNVGEAFAPPVSSPLTPQGDELQAPERKPGFFEFMLAGLVDAFTGVVPDAPRGVMVRGAELLGEGLDIPGELLGHAPINQLFGLEDTKGAFDMLMQSGPLTREKKRFKDAIARDGDNAQWYMSQYLRANAGDYAAAKGIPQVLANLIMPDATVQERLFMALGVPSQVISTFVSQTAFNRWEEILNAPDGTLSAPLEEMRRKYLAGDYGAVGTDDAINRFGDEIVRAGFGWSDDPFIGMLAEIATDPLIVANFATAGAYSAVRTGTLAARAGLIYAAAKGAAGAADNVLVQATKVVDNLVQQGSLKKTQKGTTQTYDWVKRWEQEVGNTPAGRKLIDDVEGTMSDRQRAVIKIAPMVEAAATISWMANEPFAIFGKDGVGRAMAKVNARDTTMGQWAAYGWRNVSPYFDATNMGQNAERIKRIAGMAVAYQEKVQQAGALQRLVRMNKTDANGNTVGNANLPDVRENQETIYDRMRGYVTDRVTGKRSRNLTHEEQTQMSQQAEALARRKAKFVEPDVSGIDDPAKRKAAYEAGMVTLRQEAARQLQIIGFSPQAAHALTRGANAQQLSFFHLQTWGAIINDVPDLVQVAIGRMMQEIGQIADLTDDLSMARAKELRASIEMAARLTPISDDLLTMDVARKLLDDIAKATTDADKARIVEDAVNKYELLHQVYAENVRVTSDADLIMRVTADLTEGVKNERFTQAIDPANLRKELPEVADFRDQLHAAGAQYEFGYAPAMEKRWGPIYNEKGELLGFRTWVDIVTSPETVKAPTNWQRIREAALQPVRGENIMAAARRDFRRYMNKELGVGRATSQVIWDAVRKAAADEGVTMRGFTPKQFRSILDNANISKKDRQRVGYRGLAKAVAIAMEGDVAMVGVTSRFTGYSKTRTAHTQNFLGVLSEKIYPLVRFQYNPIFQIQELVEPYFFNILRGMKVNWKFTADNVKMHELLDEFNMADRLADGFEAREFMMSGVVHAKNMAGPDTDLAKVDFGNMVQNKKRGQYYHAIKRLFGDALYKAFEKEMPGRWMEIEGAMRRWDLDNGGNGQLTRGDIAEMWFTHKGGVQPDTPWQTMHHWDGNIPDNMGRIRGITTSSLAKTLGYADGGVLRAAALDPLNKAVTEQRFKARLASQGFSGTYADRAWTVVTGPTVAEVLDSIEGDFVDKGVVGFHRELAEALLQRSANVHGVGIEEYIATKFTGEVRWLDHNARLPIHAYTQVAKRMALDFDLPSIDRSDPRHAVIAGVVRGLMPSEPDTKVKTAHVNAQKGEYDGTAPKRRDAQIQKPTTIAGMTLRAGQNATQFAKWIDDANMTPEDVADIALWYEELAGMFGGMAYGMPDEVIEELMPLLPEGTLGGPASWVDPGEKPPRMATPENFDDMTPDEQGAFFDERRARDTAWQQGMNEGVSRGAISVEDAEKRGWYAQNVRGDVTDMPAVMYHATTAMNAVTQSGRLKTRGQLAAEEGRTTGLGGGANDAISFTSDKGIADRISEVMREAVRVARGEITVDDLIQRARDGGFYDRMVQMANGEESFDRTFVRGRKHLWDPAGNRPLSLEEVVARHGDLGWEPAPDARYLSNGKTMDWERPLTQEEAAQEALDLYRGAFNLSQEEAGGPMDPLIYGGKASEFAALDVDDIGVVQATPRAGAKGYEMGGLGEWRTWSGDAVELREAQIEAARPQIGARLFMAWMSTQVQASPQAGLMSALTLMEEVANGGVRRPSLDARTTTGDWKPHMYDVQAAKYYAMLRDFDPTLPDEGFGVKLYDFSDSSMAETTRTYATLVGGMMHKRMSDGLDHPMQPGAMDMWAMRERGYVDSPILGYLAERLQRENVQAGKRGWEGEEGRARALIAVQKKTKILYRTKKTVDVLDDEGNPVYNKKGVKKTKKIDISAEEYEAAKRKFEVDNKLKEGTMRSAWSGSPSPAEYEHALKQYHDLTDALNSMKDEDGNVVGWQGRGYHTGNEWTVREIQAIAWVQMRNEFLVGDYNIQHFNSGQIQFQSDAFSPHMPIYETIPIHRASEHVRDIIAVQMGKDLAERVQRLTGATMVRVSPGSQGTNGYGVVDNTFFQLQGSPEQIRDGARVLAYLTQNSVVHGLKPQEGINATTKGKVWALDFSIEKKGNTSVVLDKLGRWLDEQQGDDFKWNGYGTGTTTEGRLAVRSVFDPEHKDLPGAVKVKQTLSRAEFEERAPVQGSVAAKLADGSWATEAGFENPIPVKTERTIYNNVKEEHDWAGDADRANARINAGEDAHTVWSEEMGRSILEDLENDGRGDIARELVTHDMEGFTAATSAALKKADPDTWADGQSRGELVGPYRGGTWKDPDDPNIRQQRGVNSRGQPVWNAATKWSKDADAAQRLTGEPRPRSGTLYFREGRADVTSVGHELFHIFADDLQPSAVRTVHDAFFDSAEGKSYLANGGTRPTGKHADNVLIREAEEWLATQFEEWLSTGVAPNGTLNGVFRDYEQYYKSTRSFSGQNVNPEMAGLFGQITPELHSGPQALYNVDEYRMMEVARMALLRAEEEAFRVHYYKRGRSFLERSINHPYLGMYPASYMWGKVLPEMFKFLIRQPFGYDAPLAGLAMANHVFEAIQLQLNTNEDIADFVEQYPEALRFLQLLVPGTPWDVPVNAPAWLRRVLQDSWSGKDPDWGGAITDSASYAFGPGRVPQDVLDVVGDSFGAAGGIRSLIAGDYQTEAEQLAEERKTQKKRAVYGFDKEAPTSPRMNPGVGQ